MPIRIVEAPDPLTAASALERPLLIDSDAIRSLTHELGRYCNQEVAGRSFLIAGHRGAGKTTSLQGAVQKIANGIQERAADLAFRRRNRQTANVSSTLQPLLVLLQGPNLLPPVEPSDEKSSFSPGSPLVTISVASSEESEKEDEPAKKSTPTPMETVLIQITLALYRSLAEEFSQSYRAKAHGFLKSPATPAQERKFRQMLEAAAGFELELDECQGISFLRQYWKLVGCLESGLLDIVSPVAAFTQDQGFRELVALASACEAYRRICGKVKRSDQKTNSAQAARKTQLALMAKGSEFSKSITSLLTGGAVASAVLAAKNSSETAILAGLLSALASTLVFKASSTRSRKQNSKRSDLFIPDLTVATLDRLLPLLIQRIRRAGLAPIFMVDELDKIEQPSRIDDTLKVLKKLVAEKAFFCFLTDRSYFEELNQKLNETPYTVESTFYTHRIFIVFKHQDLHVWLDKVLRLSDPPNSEDAADVQLVPYVVLHAARMHPIDVRRQLLSIRNANGEFRYPQGEIRSRPRFRFELSIQVAIELVLEEPAISNEIDLRPDLLQLAHDSLYYISRRWHSAPDPLDLSEIDGRAAFHSYLCKRKASAQPRPQVPVDTVINSSEPKHDPLPDVLNEDPAIAELMFQSVRKVAALLVLPYELQQRARMTGRPPAVVDALSPNPLLYPLPNEADVYRWHAYPSGADIQVPLFAKPAVAPAPKRSTERSQINFVLEFDRVLAKLTNSTIDPAALSSQYGVLPTSPAWADVRRAMQRLDQAKRDTEYPDRGADLAVLDQYTALLKTYSRGTALALVFGEAFNKHVSIPDKSFGIEIIASALRFQSIAATEVEDKLNVLIERLPGFPNFIPISFAPPTLDQNDGDSPEAWQQWIEKTATELEPFLQAINTTSSDVLSKAWEYWEQRFRVSTALDPELSTILCQVRYIGPGQFLHFDLSKVFIGDWSRAFVEGISVFTQPQSPIPHWLPLIALQQLGFNQQRLQLVTNALKSFTPDVPNLFASGTASPDPLPLATVVLSGDQSRVASWLPDPAAPILWIYRTDPASISPLLQAILIALQFNFVSIDLPNTTFSPSPVGFVDPLVHIKKPDIEMADLLVPTRPPIPVVVVASPGKSADPRFVFVPANSPQEIFAAVRDTNRPPSA